MTAAIANRLEALQHAVEEEKRLLAVQLARSRAARAASPLLRNDATQRAPAAALPSPPRAGSIAATELSAPHSPGSAGGSSPASPSASPPRAVLSTTATHKEGALLHLVRSTSIFGGGSGSFVMHYVVVSGSGGIAWYASEAAYRQQPRRPLGHAHFWVETFNSRGSRFKKAAVCWPLILASDCPEAKDPSKTYFAIDYYTPNGAREQMVLAASSPAERDAWVLLLTKYIDLYLAPRAESQELQYIQRGAAVPMHRSGVIDGEAPGGTVL
ncbi:hypothetical protein NESM_000807400 [Novymonas esmeraldas]|uniref:PH domain-containing protein n=1 Tax=Novymonas esmeraldas TaxID=1808958 RepID=A0AAW0EY81_9TRYP